MLTAVHHRLQHLLARLPAAMPSACALCGLSGDAAICGSCRAQFFEPQQHRCVQCAIPLPLVSNSMCGDCLKHRPAFDATIVATDYMPPVDQLVLALKFGSRLALAPWIAGLLRDALLLQALPQAMLPTLLTAVPLGPRRLIERGYNQALEIAKPFSRALGIRLEPQLVLRLRDTQAQSELPPADRRQNMRQAFVVSAQAIDRVRGQHIGVVDDVMTTGETLQELAATLKRFGATRVTNYVFARTPAK